MQRFTSATVSLVIILAMTWITSSLTACRGRTGPAGASIRGLPGLNGSNGSNGSNGNDGSNGAQGPAGADGTEIVPVKFCAEAASYPSTFPEYGLCINGQLFAVYSTHGGFLALIPNGAYNSNAVGSNCNFTVNGCEVSH